VELEGAKGRLTTVEVVEQVLVEATPLVETTPVETIEKEKKLEKS
jgi:hypothetical protein